MLSLAFPATALMKLVFPVPGGPHNKYPRLSINYNKQMSESYDQTYKGLLSPHTKL